MRVSPLPDPESDGLSPELTCFGHVKTALGRMARRLLQEPSRETMAYEPVSPVALTVASYVAERMKPGGSEAVKIMIHTRRRSIDIPKYSRQALLDSLAESHSLPSDEMRNHGVVIIDGEYGERDSFGERYGYTMDILVYDLDDGGRWVCLSPDGQADSDTRRAQMQELIGEDLMAITDTDNVDLGIIESAGDFTAFVPFEPNAFGLVGLIDVIDHVTSPTVTEDLYIVVEDNQVWQCDPTTLG